MIVGIPVYDKPYAHFRYCCPLSLTPKSELTTLPNPNDFKHLIKSLVYLITVKLGYLRSNTVLTGVTKQHSLDLNQISTNLNFLVLGKAPVR